MLRELFVHSQLIILIFTFSFVWLFLCFAFFFGGGGCWFFVVVFFFCSLLGVFFFFLVNVKQL